MSEANQSRISLAVLKLELNYFFAAHPAFALQDALSAAPPQLSLPQLALALQDALSPFFPSHLQVSVPQDFPSQEFFPQQPFIPLQLALSVAAGAVAAPEFDLAAGVQPIIKPINAADAKAAVVVVILFIVVLPKFKVSYCKTFTALVKSNIDESNSKIIQLSRSKLFKHYCSNEFCNAC